MNEEKVIKALTKRYGWTDRFVKEFLSNARYAMSLSEAYGETYYSDSIYGTSDMPGYNNPFTDDVVQGGI